MVFYYSYYYLVLFSCFWVQLLLTIALFLLLPFISSFVQFLLYLFSFVFHLIILITFMFFILLFFICLFYLLFFCCFSLFISLLFFFILILIWYYFIFFIFLIHSNIFFIFCVLCLCDDGDTWLNYGKPMKIHGMPWIKSCVDSTQFHLGFLFVLFYFGFGFVL